MDFWFIFETLWLLIFIRTRRVILSQEINHFEFKSHAELDLAIEKHWRTIDLSTLENKNLEFDFCFSDILIFTFLWYIFFLCLPLSFFTKVFLVTYICPFFPRKTNCRYAFFGVQSYYLFPFLKKSFWIFLFNSSKFDVLLIQTFPKSALSFFVKFSHNYFHEILGLSFWNFLTHFSMDEKISNWFLSSNFSLYSFQLFPLSKALRDESNNFMEIFF